VRLLAKKMIAAVEILDAVQARAFDLHIADSPARDWVKEFQASKLTDDTGQEQLSSRGVFSSAGGQKDQTGSKSPASQGSEEDDLIDMQIRSYVKPAVCQPPF
jgi:hypothetical protein